MSRDAASPPPIPLRRPSSLRRAALALAGVALLPVGIAGLVLPGLQGVLTLLASGVLLSLGSDRALRLLRRGFRGWPRGWRRFLRLRNRLARRLLRTETPATPGSSSAFRAV